MTADFIGCLPLGDRQYTMDFNCPANAGRGAENVVSWIDGPYDFSINDANGNSRDALVIQFAYNVNNFKNWGTLTVTGLSGNTTSQQVVTVLNANAEFANLFSASVTNQNRILITQKMPASRMKFFIANGRAEEALRFNAKAGIAQLPTFFQRQRISTSPDTTDLLMLLTPATSAVDKNVIDAAVDAYGKSLGYDGSVTLADYVLLKGHSGLFAFKKITVDGSDRITQIVEYHAGAIVGDFARKITYVYTGTNQNPSQITEEPYTLTSGDLITPP